MFIKQPCNAPARDQHTSLHVLFHCVPGEVRAGDETHPAVCDSDFGVDAAVGKRISLVVPGLEIGGRNQRPHFADRVEGNTAAVLLGQLKQH